MKYEIINYCEIDKYASKSYAAVHGVSEDMNLGDITGVDVESLPQDIGLLTHGSPCFPKGVKVLTNKGYKSIENIEIGDLVLTHTNQFKKVTKLYKNTSSDLYKLKVQCSSPIVATGNHPFYARKKYTDYKRKSETYGKRLLKEPTWVELSELSKDYYIGVAINNLEEYPEWEGVENNRCNQSHLPIDNLHLLFNKLQFWYFVGRYIGDGWVTEGYSKKEKKPTYRTTVCCSFKEAEEFEKEIEGLFNYNKIKDRTVYKYQFSNKELTLFLKQFGKGASNKCLTGSILNLPKKELAEFMRGYLDSDGSRDKDHNLFKMSSVSEELILGMGQVIAKLYNKPFSIYKSVRSEKHIIEGRVVNQKPSYNISYKPEDSKTHGFYEDGILWLPIRKLERLESEEVEVYNLEVEDDHTYTVNNIIVHNCTSFSQAGLQQGGDKGSGTASSLMWHSVEIIHHTRPKFVIWENVKNVLSKRHKHNFDEYIDKLSEYGYESYYEVLNAKDYGVPQNRERIFVISIRKDISKGFTFPEVVKLHRTMRDYLDDIVEDRWFLNEKQIKSFMESNYVQRQRRLQEKDWVDTLCARDYKEPKAVRVEKGIRNLTPKEYWKLMGFSVECFEKAQAAGISNSQLYKQAGNSIALGVIRDILQELHNQYPGEFTDGLSCLSLFSGVGAFEMALDKVENTIIEKVIEEPEKEVV